MEEITEKEIEFLLFVNASEESYLKDVASDIGKWNCDKTVVVEIIKELVLQDFLDLGKFTLEDSVDLQKEKALETITSWENMQTSMLILFLKEKGMERWNSDTFDWGITEERKEYLVFFKK